ncbi:DUF4168 domain-containing protein [Phormidium sp. FACHB-1136]|jgi:hypothetical protein|uniref:DUF4168 domain-containing protein n=1 Tax=Phormidium sp. FACHB-1136 TaxID=2692848 RepID=UPI001687642D|nr:DUF4168 domain-containing protein [Phormidium sp. FACHB-1136]MBD2424901.1 DUF4168 domain-containing protein [Phormidium sp. FACHB-1136]
MMKLLSPLMALLLGLALSLGLSPGMAQATGLQGTLPTNPSLHLLATASVPAGEVKKFAKAYQSIQTIRDEAEAEMAQAVEAEGFTVEEFNALADQALAHNQPPDDAAVAVKFDSAIERIATLRQGAEDTMGKAIEAAGLSVDRFNEILEQSDQDADLYQRIGDQINGR